MAPDPGCADTTGVAMRRRFGVRPVAGRDAEPEHPVDSAAGVRSGIGELTAWIVGCRADGRTLHSSSCDGHKA